MCSVKLLSLYNIIPTIYIQLTKFGPIIHVRDLRVI